MKWSFASVGMVAAGMVGVVIILLFQNLTVNNEEDYYLLKEISQAAMVDAIDIAYYRDVGKLKIVQEKFVENFTRRYAEAARILNANEYSLEFYNIMEYPPKASVLIKTDIGDYTVFGNQLDAQSYGVQNKIDSLIEIDELPESIVKEEDCLKTMAYISTPWLHNGSGTFEYIERTPARPEKGEEGKKWKVRSYLYTGRVLNMTDVKKDKTEYYEDYEVQPNDIHDPEIYNYIAPVQDLIEFKIEESTEESNEYKLFWSSYYECDAINSIQTVGGEYKNNVCLIGTKYTITWFKDVEECQIYK